MPRPRTPAAKAKLTGADAHDPQRFRNRKEPKPSGRALGKAPAYLPPTAKKAWAVFADELPWLTFEDRGAVEVVCLMRAQIMDGMTAELPASFFGNYRMALSSLGATPVDRSKVHVADSEDEDDPFAAFDGKAH
jgi:phage terminase small subunit